jgi:uncharacterized protein with PIN domain
MTPTPRTDVEILRVPSCFDNIDHHVVLADFARQLETDIAELNERLMERQETLMSAIVDLKAATQILTRCRNSAGRMGIELYEDLQNFLHTQPSYRS